MNRLKLLSGKWAVVTGASSGIGLEFCRQLAAAGCNLVTVSNQPVELAKWADILSDGFGVKVLPVDLDLSGSDAVPTIVSRLNEWGIVPALLINDAGIFDFKSVNNLSGKRIDLYVDLHVRAVTHLTRKIGEMMAENGGGYILNMSSMSCWMPMPGIVLYAATKAYIRTFSRAYRIEMKERNVSVTVACPGGIATDLFGLSPKLQKLGVSVGALATPQSFVKKALSMTLGRKAQYINGFLNRLSIVVVASLPEFARTMIKTRLLDKMESKD